MLYENCGVFGNVFFWKCPVKLTFCADVNLLSRHIFLFLCHVVCTKQRPEPLFFMTSIASVSCLLFAYIYVSSSFGHMTLAKWWCNYYIKTTSWRHFGRIIKLRLLEFRGMCTRLHKSASITLVMIMKKTANIFTLVTLRPEYSAWTWSIPRLLMTQLLTSPVRRHAIIWTNAAIFSIRPQAAYFTEILFKTQNVSHWRKCTWKYRLRNGHQFVSVSMC